MPRDHAPDERAADDEARALLAAADDVCSAGWLSLCPERPHARRLVELVPDAALRCDVRVAIARSLASISAAVRRNFPENLFCDLDLVLGALERGGARHGRAWVEHTSGTIEALHDLFGCSTSIQFRYVHDFLYGFDWSRWVQRDCAARASVGPFDPIFLEYARRRGSELTALIADGDRRYHPIERGEHRNPFPFARDPSSESTLLRDLASRGWIPVEAWRRDAQPAWDREYAAERERRATELGLAL